jgi:hypothetical protein
MNINNYKDINIDNVTVTNYDKVLRFITFIAYLHPVFLKKV